MTGHGGVNGAGGAPIVVVVAGEDRVRGITGETKGGVSGGIGLSPGPAISVDPSGMPARPARKVDGAGIDVAASVLPACAQPVVPAMLPPSNSAVPICDVDPPVVPHPMVEGGAGLMPGAVSSIAPSGIPTGPTGVVGPIVKGEALSGDGPALLIWASAQPQARSVVAKVVVTKDIFMARSPPSLETPAEFDDRPSA